MLDSSLDRYAEFALYGGLAYHFRGRFPEALAALAFLGSVMVSYTRARAEGLGFECRKRSNAAGRAPRHPRAGLPGGLPIPDL